MMRLASRVPLRLSTVVVCNWADSARMVPLLMVCAPFTDSCFRFKILFWLRRPLRASRLVSPLAVIWPLSLSRLPETVIWPSAKVTGVAGAMVVLPPPLAVLGGVVLPLPGLLPLLPVPPPVLLPPDSAGVSPIKP